MCIVADTFHVPCEHWGSKTNVEPCARALGQAGLSKGCWDSRTEGVIRSLTICASCQRRETRRSADPRYTPFSDISPGAWEQIRERGRRRSLGFHADSPWTTQASPSNLGRRRSDPVLESPGLSDAKRHRSPYYCFAEPFPPRNSLYHFTTQCDRLTRLTTRSP